MIGLLAIAAWLSIFVIASGFSGFLVALGLAAVVVGIVALIRGRMSWALPSPTFKPGTALAVAAALLVKGRAPKSGY